MPVTACKSFCYYNVLIFFVVVISFGTRGTIDCGMVACSRYLVMQEPRLNI